MATPSLQMRQEGPKQRAQRLLDRLTELRDHLSAETRQFDVALEALNDEIPEETRHRIDQTRQARADKVEEVNLVISKVDADLRDAVIEVGETLTNGTLQAIYGVRVAWDNKKLEGYAVAHPEVLKFRAQKAQVTVRATNAKQREGE